MLPEERPVCAGFHRLGRWILHPFVLAAPPKLTEGRLARLIAVCRAALGLILLHQFLDALGFVFIFPEEAPGFRRWLLASLVAAGFLTSGLLTPLSLAILIYQLAFHSLTHSLGDQVTVIVLWLLLLLGAGRTWSMDAWLMRLPGCRPFVRALYLLAVDLRPHPVACVRLLALLLFWGICLSAMIFHVNDPVWRKGQVLQLVLTMSYFNDHYEMFNACRERFPWVFQMACYLALVVQSVWELFLVPLMYQRHGRILVFSQGWLFFLFALVFLNLQYLPLVELVLWLLLFGCPGSLAWARLQEKASAAEISPIRPQAGPVASFGSRAIPWVAGTGFAAVLFQLAACPSFLPEAWAAQRRIWHARLSPVSGLFGQGLVCVFNKEDLRMGCSHFMLYEVDELGTPLHIVPFLDTNGGRLRYLRNDLLYFRSSLSWQRNSSKEVIASADCFEPDPRTQELIRRVALLDACLTRCSGSRSYRAEFFVRDMLVDQAPCGWSAAHHVGSWSVLLAQETIDVAAGANGPIYDLPPGHLEETNRLDRTWRFVTSLSLHEQLAKKHAAPLRDTRLQGGEESEP